ncbi:substrate-binding periplasmic protein [Spartinivicinus poritis]|uniref:Transporter substrate-binding domain-containing protein n=1 Tax=Spartinivicinus poritis TaxID=2994640 RepID=A0ABT5UEC3_9GAMM|nr:transporter substrate-binding domain-containing protein [Spartinivicinus sp. A2-2]MDE1464356.1 transporter substrate-binding domain-containing protein [Spartinivicinus sp. A2-2]
MAKLLFILMIIHWLPFTLSSFAAPVIKVYTTDEPPLNFSTGKSKDSAAGTEVSGFATDIVREILTLTHNTTTPIVLLPWARAYQYTLHSENVFLFSMGRTKQREQLFQWIGPLAEKKAALYSTQQTQVTINSLDDAKAVSSIATVIDDSKEQYLKSQGFTNLSSSPKWSQAIQKLFINRAALLAQTDLDIPFIIREVGYSINAIKPVYKLYKFQLFIGTSKKTSAQLVNQWQQALNTLKKNGRFKELIKKWSHHYQLTNWQFQNGMLQVND